MNSSWPGESGECHPMKEALQPVYTEPHVAWEPFWLSGYQLWVENDSTCKPRLDGFSERLDERSSSEHAARETPVFTEDHRSDWLTRTVLDHRRDLVSAHVDASQ